MMCDTIDVYVAHHCIHQSSNVLILSFFAYVCANIKSVLQCSSTRFANACNGATREHGERKNNEVQHTRNRLMGATAMLIPLAACGGGSSNSGQPSQESNVKEIDVWAWDPSLKQIAADYEKKTGIKVNLKNVGTNTKEYTQLDNAIEAGSGAPMSPKSSTTHCPNMRSREICLTSQIRRAGTKTSIIRDHGRQCK